MPNTRLATFYLLAPVLSYSQMLHSFFVDPVGGTVGDHLRIDTFLNDLYNGSTSKTSNAITQKLKQRIGAIFQKERLCMHIVYIEFGASKSNQYKKVCNLAKQIPNYHFCDGVTQCYIDDIKDYVRLQDVVLTLIEKINKWKRTTILLYGNKYESSLDYYNFVETLKQSAGKYKIFIRHKNEYDNHRGIVTYEDLPMPVVYYPGYSGAFFAFSEDVGEKIYFCECERHAIENYIQLKRQRITGDISTATESPLEEYLFPPIIASISKGFNDAPLTPFGFRENLCFRCNKKIPKEKFCLPMYGGLFKQRFGWYIRQEELRMGIDRRQIRCLNILPEECTPELYDCIYRLSKAMEESIQASHNDNSLMKLRREYENAIENVVRTQMGYPKIGDAWVSETMLYHIIEEIYPNIEIIRHHRPNWLEGLELDIYIPSKQLAFEYQGLQHFQAVEHWGGKEKLEIQKEHDSRKKRICQEKGITLICINYDEELTNEYIRKRIALEGVT